MSGIMCYICINMHKAIVMLHMYVYIFMCDIYRLYIAIYIQLKNIMFHIICIY